MFKPKLSHRLLFTSLISFFVSLQTFAYSVKTYTQQITPNSTQIKMDVDVLQKVQQADILFVVDNSGSMTPYQTLLSNNIGRLLNKFNGYDLHAAVISTDFENYQTPGDKGEFAGGVLNGTDPNFLSKLSKSILLGTNGSAIEKIFSPVVAALTPPLSQNINKGFLRESAQLIIFFITDAEDQSYMMPDEFVVKIKSLKKDSTKISFAGLYIPSSVTTTVNCERDGSPNLPVRLETILNQFPSFTMSLCSTDFSGDLEKLGQNLISSVGLSVSSIRSFKLPLAPDISTLKVAYGAKNLVAGDSMYGWTYDSHAMLLNIGQLFNYTSEPAGTKLLIEYTSAQ